jgi:hypothetical protein
MKFVDDRPYADPDIAARKLVELANAVEAAQDGRIHIEKINGPMLFQLKATPAEYKAGSIAPSLTAGWCCTRAVPLYVLRRLVQIFLHEERQILAEPHCSLNQKCCDDRGCASARLDSRAPCLPPTPGHERSAASAPPRL